jgi:hypothetical protein
MDVILMAWRVIAISIIALVLIVLYCLMGFVSSAIAERRTAKQIEAYLPDDAEGLLSDLTHRLVPLAPRRLITSLSPLMGSTSSSRRTMLESSMGSWMKATGENGNRQGH